MAIHTTMVEAMDREVGRIVAELKSAGLFDETFILFASDNGASAEMLIRGEGHDPAAPPGSRKTFLCLRPGWSSCANAPFRRHKMWVHEGGHRHALDRPLAAGWPGCRCRRCTVAGKRIDGHDRRGAFADTEDAAASEAVTHWYYYRTGELQAVRRGRWKLLQPHTASSMTGQEPGLDGRIGKPAPLKVGRELYDLRGDVADLHDVAAEHREIVAERRACRVLGFTRSSFRYKSRRNPWAELRVRLRDLVASRVHYGYQRLWFFLRRDEWLLNKKLVYRLYCEEGLGIRRRKPRRRKSVQIREARPPTGQTNESWSMDFMADQLVGGQRLTGDDVV